MKRFFPDREIVEVPKDHPVFSCFYKMDGYPQVAGLGSFLAGRTWEKGGVVPHLRTILDDSGRPWCSSIGTPTWATAGNGPTHRSTRDTSSTPPLAYRMAINEIVYSLTH